MNKIVGPPKEYQLIELPPWYLEKLKRKRTEYAERVTNFANEIKESNPNWHPGQIRHYYSISRKYYKLAILSELLSSPDGTLNTFELAKELANEAGEINEPGFNMACRIIQDYCLTGGQKTRGGTGLR